MRIFTAFSWFFKILFNGQKAFDSLNLEAQPATETPAPQEERPEFHVSHAPATQLLGLLQKEGRLIDFLQEDISQYDDGDIGAAVRDIHAGCRRVLEKNIVVKAISEVSEGDAITLETGFNPSHYELIGNLTSAQGKVSGSIIHRGWYAESINLPTVAEGQDENVVAPAQVEVN